MNRRSAIDGKVVIVTGASSGIGESTAREFAQAGAITVLAARRAERLKQLEREIEEMGGKAFAVPTDLTSLDQITNLVQTTLSTFGRIDVLANIAGWGRPIRDDVLDAQPHGSLDLHDGLVRSCNAYFAQLAVKLGPEPLAPRFDAAVLSRELRRRRTPLKIALSDQRVIAGLGNIYVSEALWRAEVSPRRRACNVGPVRAARLHRAIVDVLTEAIREGDDFSVGVFDTAGRMVAQGSMAELRAGGVSGQSLEERFMDIVGITPSSAPALDWLA